MPSTRLLCVALLICPALMFAQTNRRSQSSIPSPQPSTAFSIPDFRTPAATRSEPWRIIPQTPEYEARNFVIDPDGSDVIAPGGADATCYAIRSYVVARDSNDSEATHPVAYSTCQPAHRYGLKKVTVAPPSAQR